MVAQQVLALFVLVRIQAGQPSSIDARRPPAVFFFAPCEAALFDPAYRSLDSRLCRGATGAPSGFTGRMRPASNPPDPPRYRPVPTPDHAPAFDARRQLRHLTVAISGSDTPARFRPVPARDRPRSVGGVNVKSSAIPGGPRRAPWLSGQPDHVLIALCGCSPAVIPETVWALAHEAQPVLPRRVVAVTTAEGRQAIRRELFESRVWESLRDALGAGPDRLQFGDSADAVRVIPRPDRRDELDDVRDDGDTLAVADFLLETLRQFSEDPGVQVVLSIAGGRKTMSVAAALALTLLGRRGDRMCHVLAAPPFDRPDLEPRFYFPDPAVPEYVWVDPEGERRVYGPSEARIVLADIPYVRVRYLLSMQYGPIAPSGYREMVAAALSCADAVAPPVLLTLDPGKQSVAVGGVEVGFTAAPYGLLLFLAVRARCGCPPLVAAKTLQAELRRFLGRLNETIPTPFAAEAKRRIDSAGEPDYARKLIHSVQRRLAALDLPSPVRRRLVLRAPGRPGLYALMVRPEEVDVPDAVTRLVRDCP